jgi:hypothetical protein
METWKVALKVHQLVALKAVMKEIAKVEYWVDSLVE